MKRKDFFKKLGLGTAGVVYSPKILQSLANLKPSGIKVIPKASYSGDVKLLTELQSQLNINLQSAILKRLDIQWTKEDEQILLNTRRYSNG